MIKLGKIFTIDNPYWIAFGVISLAGCVVGTGAAYAQATGDPVFDNPLVDLYPVQDNIDVNGVDLANGKIHFRGELVPVGAGGLGVDVHFLSPGFAITDVHYSSDPPLSVSNSLGQIVYASLSVNAVLSWQPVDESRQYPVPFVNFDAPSEHERFVNAGTSFYNLANNSSSIVSNGSGYTYTSKQGSTANISSSLIYLQLYTPLSPGSGYVGNVVTNLTRPNGEVWSYYYDSQPLMYSGIPTSRIRSIVSNRGYAMQFSYQRDGAFSTNDQLDQWYAVTQIIKYDKARNYCDENSGVRCSSFGESSQVLNIYYDRVANTVQFTRPNGETMKFGFSLEPRWGAWRVVSFTKGGVAATQRTITYREYPSISYPAGATLPDPNTWLDNVQSVSAGGQTWNYEYTGIHYGTNWDSSSTMRRTDPGGKITSLDMTLLQDPPTKITDPINRVTKFNFFRYSAASIFKGAQPDTVLRPNEPVAYPLTISLPEDTNVGGTPVSSYQFSYDDRGNRLSALRNSKAGSGLSAIGWSESFPPCGNLKQCNKPATITDPRGGITSYSYDATHGGIVSEMAPAPVAGSARPLKLYGYAQKYAYVLNSSGTLVPSGSPVWVPTTMTECQTSAGSDAAVCDNAAQQRTVTYEYGADGTADNLLVRGVAVTADGQIQRSCFGYDAQSNKVSEARPRAGLSNCQ